MTFLAILFWILFILSILGCFAEQPWVVRPSRLVLLILIGILGFKVLGNPIS